MKKSVIGLLAVILFASASFGAGYLGFELQPRYGDEGFEHITIGTGLGWDGGEIGAAVYTNNFFRPLDSDWRYRFKWTPELVENWHALLGAGILMPLRTKDGFVESEKPMMEAMLGARWSPGRVSFSHKLLWARAPETGRDLVFLTLGAEVRF